MIALIANFAEPYINDTALAFSAAFIDQSTTPGTVFATYQDVLYLQTELTTYTNADFKTLIEAKVAAYAVTNSISVSNTYWISPNIQPDWNQTDSGQADFILNKPVRSFTSNPSRTIQTVAAAGNGWTLSATRDANISYSVDIETNATDSDGSVIVEIAAINSATPGDWTEIGRIRNSQASNQHITGCISFILPAGYYTRLRAISTTGSPTFTLVSGQEVLL